MEENSPHMQELPMLWIFWWTEDFTAEINDHQIFKISKKLMGEMVSDCEVRSTHGKSMVLLFTAWN